MYKYLQVSLFLYWTVMSTAAEPIDIASACEEGNIETVRQYLEAGEDPNQKLPARSIISAKDGSFIMGGGPSTMLGIATFNNHANVVELLLEYGANPNQPSQDTTPLVLNLLNMAATCTPPIDSGGVYDVADPSSQIRMGPAYIEDPSLREQALVPMRRIRDLLLAHGAISDWGPYIRRKKVTEFQQFLDKQQENVLYALCSPAQIIFYSKEPVQQFDVPDNIKGNMRGWFSLKNKIAAWLKTKTKDNYLSLAIIGPTEMRQPVLWGLESLCKKQNIPASLYVISNDIHCDSATLFKAFTNPDHAQSDVIDILNEYCPCAPISPFTKEVETELLAL